MSAFAQLDELREQIGLSQRDFEAALPYVGRGCSVHAAGSAARLAWALESALQAHVRYQALDIPESVYFDTMRDIRVWCDCCRAPGLRNTSWLVHHMQLELFQIGRLQFQMGPFQTPSFAECPKILQSSVLQVHIPQGKPLDDDACRQSLRDAVTFFDTYFPAYAYRAFVCESWLLFDGNAQFMDPQSNILKFASLFHPCGSTWKNPQGYDRIFGARRPRFSRPTSLQKRAMHYILRGGRLGVGFGYILKKDIV